MDITVYRKLHALRMRAIEKALAAIKRANQTYQSERLQAAQTLIYQERTEAIDDMRRMENVSEIKKHDTHSQIFKSF